MSDTNSIQSSTSSKWLARSGWTIILILGVWFLTTVAFKYFLFSETVYERFWDIKWWVLGHVLGGSLALIIGPFQFWSHFRNKYMKTHRLMGKIYLISIAIGSICAFKMAATTALAISWQWAISLGILGVAWVLTAFMAYRSVRLKRISQHKEWMVRSYVVTFAFVTFRILLIIGIGSGLGNFPEVAPTMGWASWTLPLLITEMYIQAGKKE